MRTRTTAAACCAALLALQPACGRRVDVNNLNAPAAARNAASQEAARAALKAQSEELARAFGGGDFAKVADLSHPSLVELSGGKPHMIEDMAVGMEEMRADGLEYESVSVGDPGQLVPSADGRQLFAVVPNVHRVKTPQGVTASRSYFLGISEDGGARWTFVDGTDIEDKADLKSLFPSAPDELALPEQPPPGAEGKP